MATAFGLDPDDVSDVSAGEAAHWPAAPDHSPALTMVPAILSLRRMLLVCLGLGTAVIMALVVMPPPTAPEILVTDIAGAVLRTNAEATPVATSDTRDAHNGRPSLLLPHTAPLTVFIIYRNQDAAAAIRAAALVVQLRRDTELLSTHLIPTAARTAPSIGCFFTEDLPGAAALGEKLRGAFGPVRLLQGATNVPAWPGAVVINLP